MKKLYTYDGPVMIFDKCVINHWKGSTYATSEAKARCNLAYQFKIQNCKIPRSVVSLPGKLEVAE